MLKETLSEGHISSFGPQLVIPESAFRALTGWHTHSFLKEHLLQSSAFLSLAKCAVEIYEREWCAVVKSGVQPVCASESQFRYLLGSWGNYQTFLWFSFPHM